ncbi:MAG TPA: hypothetical protein VLW52_09245 [Opitutaceae bacterium]|nr:hypothetical protein [Opitutaceae bacterium]
MSIPTQLVTGLGGAIGCDLRRSHSQLLFVEYAGKLSRLNLFPSSTVVSSGTKVLKGTYTFDLENGNEGGVGPGFDIWWDQQTAVARQMVPQNGATIVNLGVVDFASITASGLQFLPYSTTPINGSNDATNKLVTGDVFAVRTSAGHFAKVKVVSYGYDLNIQWVTYQLDPAYVVLGTGYLQPEDVKVSVDDLHVYVTERPGNLLRVALATPNRAAATVVCSGMTAPQQFFLDEAHQAAYAVEYASPGRLWRINLTTGAKTAVVSNLENAVGIVLSADLQYAYVSEQTAGPDKGRISQIRLSDGSRQKLATGLINPFFLTWADDAETSLLVPERDPVNDIRSISVTGGGVTVVATGVPFRPSSVAVPTAGEMLVCSDAIIEEIDFGSGIFQPAGPLLMGIGFIPFDKVLGTGLADTTSDPTYFYQVKNTPFGGTLPLMVNYLRAFNDGTAYYRVKVDGVVRLDSWTDEKWNGTQYVPQTTAPVMVGGAPGYYPVHPISELFLWMNPSLGSLMDSTSLSNGLHTIVLEFVNGAGVLVETSTPLTIMVNNESCVATIAAPILNGHSADPVCGFLQYAAKNADLVYMGFTASQPHNYATYSFTLIKGVNTLTPPSTSGPVPPAVSPITGTVATLMGACNVAGFAEYVYVAATINNGWGRQSQYDASAAIAFVLAP